MKKRSDKFIALLLCAFMAFSLIAAAADVPVEGCAECGLTEGHSESCSQYEAPVDPEPSTEPETPADPEPSTEPETPADPKPSTEPETPADPKPSTEPETPADPVPSTEPETPADPKPSTEPETPADPVPSTEPETPAAPVPSTEPEDPVELEPASLNGDAAGMNFTVAGELPVGGKLQVEAIDASCNDYIVETYLKDVELPAGLPIAFDLTILTEDGKVYEPAAGNEITVSVSGSQEDAFCSMTAYHLPGVTAGQIVGAVKALAEGEVSAQDQPAILDADGNPIRYYEQLPVDSYANNGKNLFSFTTNSFSVFFLVAEVSSEHTDGCAGADCTIESCPCPCHSLYARLMACTTVEELQAVVVNVTEEDLADLSEMQIAALQEHILSIVPEEEVEAPQTVVFTNAGPFMPPVEVAVSGSGN